MLVEQPTRIFYVSSIDDMNNIEIDYQVALAEGNLAILHDAGGMPSQIYAWSGPTLDWQMLSSVSNPGPILVDATTIDDGVVKFAADGECSPLKAVQANDSRLTQWVAQSTPPSQNVLWIDTSTTLPTVKWYNGTAWVYADNQKIIDDMNISKVTAYSSNLMESRLALKSDSNHTHASYDSHIANKNNPHQVKCAQITDFEYSVSTNSDVLNNTLARHTHNNVSVLNALAATSDGMGLIFNGKTLGYGNMNISTYDTSGDGIIDVANKITSQGQTFDVTRLLSTEVKAHTHANMSTLDNTTASFTTDLLNKLNGIDAGANKYVLPTSLPATMITTDETHRFITDNQLVSFADKYTKSEVDSLTALKEDKINKGVANGYAGLDRNGFVPISQLPLSVKETQVVPTIADRNMLSKYVGLRVVVADASTDPLVGVGVGEYIWDGNVWLLISTAPRKSVMSNNILQMVTGVENDRITNPPSDGILFFATDSKKIYLYLNGNCVMFASNNSIVPGINKIQESMVLKAGQTLVTLTEGTYTPLDDNIDLFIDGIVQPKEAFDEINDSQIKLKQPIEEDCNITLEYISEY